MLIINTFLSFSINISGGEERKKKQKRQRARKEQRENKEKGIRGGRFTGFFWIGSG